MNFPRKDAGMSGTPAYDLWIDGDWRQSTGGTRLDVTDPVTGGVSYSIVNASSEDVDAAVASAKSAAAGRWRSDAGLRFDSLLRLSELIIEHAEELAGHDTSDSGRLQHQAVGQVRNIARWYRYFAGLTDKIQGETSPNDSPTMFTYTMREPLGVILAITAWNAPLLLATLKLAPALAAGNAVILKPSELSAASTLEFARLCLKAGMPAGVVNVVTGDGAGPGARLVSHPGVDHITFTGSVDGGRRVAAAAGQHLKGVTLELGGKSPNVIFDDADLDAAVVGSLAGIFTLTGQSCISGSRLLVQRGVYEEVISRLKARVDSLVMGSSEDPDAEVGPVSNAPQMQRIERLVGGAKRDGARLVSGGRRADREGLFFLPTIFADVDNDSELARAEVFGPVLAIIPFDTEGEAVRIANETSFGLASGVWTQDLSRAHRMASSIQAGSVYINNYRGLGPAVPFGGYKDSGVGRENGLQAVLDFTQVKSVWLETAPSYTDTLKRS
jgi:acyl-CoA reductase-like NAD-dependent aldehyde dehydrogenase